MNIRVATFNVENLFARYRFRSNQNPSGATGFGINDLAFSVYDAKSKRITANAIREVNADIICLQEVEDIKVLERFNSRYLGRLKYKHRLVIDSHDPRYIDIAVLSRYPFSYINTHRHERNKKGTTWLFSRDCLEVDIDVNGKSLSLYVNHFKSMMGGRAKTRPRRQEQARRVAEIVDEWWRGHAYNGNFIVLGDLNDYVDEKTSLGPLIRHPALVNVVEKISNENERWTHYWAGGNEYRQLDYLLLSKSLADANHQRKPGIERRGLPRRAKRYTGPRFSGVDDNHPKASDHCPLYIDLNLI